MRAGPSPGFGASPQHSQAGLGAFLLPGLTKPGLVQNQSLLMALKEYFQQLCPNHKHVELEDRGSKMKEGTSGRNESKTQESI